jgi:flagellar basal body-associated protein FliL
MSSLDSYPMFLFLLYIIIMITLILFVLANVIAIAMHQFKDDQNAVLMLA